ncbi:unnamed protein product [Pleuronectes platessa]|uniref:Uncharacterized protein n=1 Tax=Pleuronectes platessa TaxID=8262 RepID=A0A9N7VG13_PLEPL|nr:unnamed protein product [Pleuronectes platessa]
MGGYLARCQGNTSGSRGTTGQSVPGSRKLGQGRTDNGLFDVSESSEGSRSPRPRPVRCRRLALTLSFYISPPPMPKRQAGWQEHRKTPSDVTKPITVMQGRRHTFKDNSKQWETVKEDPLSASQ